MQPRAIDATSVNHSRLLSHIHIVGARAQNCQCQTGKHAEKRRRIPQVDLFLFTLFPLPSCSVHFYSSPFRLTAKIAENTSAPVCFPLALAGWCLLELPKDKQSDHCLDDCSLCLHCLPICSPYRLLSRCLSQADLNTSQTLWLRLPVHHWHFNQFAYIQCNTLLVSVELHRARASCPLSHLPYYGYGGCVAIGLIQRNSFACVFN